LGYQILSSVFSPHGELSPHEKEMSVLPAKLESSYSFESISSSQKMEKCLFNKLSTPDSS